MIQEVQKIENSIRERIRIDVPLVNYALYLFLLSWLTLGIYPIYLFFKRIRRIDKFIIRKRDYYEGTINFTEKYLLNNKQNDVLRNEMHDLKNLYVNSFQKETKEIKPGLSFFLIIVTLGIWWLVVLYKLNKVWDDLQKFEYEFDDKLSIIWNKSGLMKYPINFQIEPSKNRSYILYLFLTIITFGIWGIVWDYKIHTDPNKLYREFHSAEDTVLNIVRNA